MRRGAMRMLTRLKFVIPVLLLALAVAGHCSPEEKMVEKATASGTQVQSEAQEGDFFESLGTYDAAEKSKEKEPSVTMTVLGFFGKLILVLAIAFASIYGLKKLNNWKVGFAEANRNLVVVEQTSIGPGRQLHLVKVAGKSLLLGSTAQQINVIAELDPALVPNAPEQSVGFKEQLSGFIGHNPKTDDTAKSVAQMLQESAQALKDNVSQVGNARRELKEAGNE